MSRLCTVCIVRIRVRVRVPVRVRVRVCVSVCVRMQACLRACVPFAAHDALSLSGVCDLPCHLRHVFQRSGCKQHR